MDVLLHARLASEPLPCEEATKPVGCWLHCACSQQGIALGVQEPPTNLWRQLLSMVLADCCGIGA